MTQTVCPLLECQHHRTPSPGLPAPLAAQPGQARSHKTFGCFDRLLSGYEEPHFVIK